MNAKLRRDVELEHKAVYERYKRRRYILLSSVSIAIALFGTTAGFFSTLSDRSHNLFEYSSDARTRAQLEYQAAELARAQDQLHQVIVASEETQQNMIEASRRKGSVLYKEGLSPEDKERLRKIEDGQTELGTRLGALESTILETPEKAVSVPVLKQQIGDLQDKYRSDNDAMHAELGRMYTMMSIFFGSMVALIVGISGLFFSIFKHRSDRSPRSDRESSPPSDSPPSSPPSLLSIPGSSVEQL